MQKSARHQKSAEQLHDKILFMANTGIRPDEANWLEYRDIEIVEDEATGETILEIEVRGINDANLMRQALRTFKFVCGAPPLPFWELNAVILSQPGGSFLSERVDGMALFLISKIELH